MTVCLAANGGTMYQGETLPTRLVVGTAAGVVFLQRSNGSAWQPRGHALPDTHISSLLYEPSNGYLFAGVHGGGLYVSMDDGESWAPRTNGLTNRHVWSLARVEREGRVFLYAGTEPASLFRSSDYGATWEELPSLRNMPGSELWDFPPPPHIAHARAIAFDPRDSRTMYVGIEQGGLFKSADAGQTWRELDSWVRPDDVFNKDVHRVVVSPMNPARVYMIGGDGAYSSADAGETWERSDAIRSVRIGYPEAIVLSPVDDRVLFVAGASGPPTDWQSGTATFGLARTDDGGQSWETLIPRLPRPLSSTIEGMTLQSRPDGFSIFAGTATGEVLASDDDGENWSMIAESLAPISQSTHYRRFRPSPSSAADQQPAGTR